MAAKFDPLSFPAPFNDLPLNYAQRITLYHGEGNFTSIQHVDRFYDFIDQQKVDYEDVKMRLFVQILSREAKKWFRDFVAGSTHTFQAFQTHS